MLRQSSLKKTPLMKHFYLLIEYWWLELRIVRPTRTTTRMQRKL
jgi:hypothetical protein